MARDQQLATLIGDLVQSKRHSDRPGLQRAMHQVLGRVNSALQPSQALELTVGDEFQGGFATVGAAVRASLVIRLELLAIEGGADSRYGLGRGAVTVFDPGRTPTSQDGPGWWSARAAIDRAKKLSGSPRTSFVRTCFGYGDADADGPNVDAAALEAHLLCRDAAIDQMNVRQRRLLLGLLHGRTQAELAARERITQSAVSQSLRHSSALAIEAAQLRLDEAPR